MGRSRILIVDDEADIRDILQFNLENAGYVADSVPSAEAGLEKLQSGYDLVLLDVMMEGMSGFKMAEIIRKEYASQIPIIFLTAKNAEKDLLRGFAAGGDDYVGKPFSILEVLARVRAVLGRSASSHRPDVLTEGKITIDISKRTVTVDGEPVAMSKKEFEILYLLASNEGKIFSREDIIGELWKDAPYVLDRTVDVHIARIRGKLGPCKNYIVNRSGYGYCFVPSE